MPDLLVKLALLLIIVRSVYITFLLSQKIKKPWLDLLYYISIAVVAMSFLLR